MKMNVAPASRLTICIAIAFVATLAVAIVYRKLEGDNLVALVLGISAISFGVAFVVLRMVERRRHYRSAVTRSAEIGIWDNRARKTARLGAVVAVGSFAWLFFAIKFLNAESHLLFFYIWLVVFLIGAVMLFAPSLLRIAVELNIVDRRRDGE
jgi:peptidoglycan/LPS O-acetylase OafA/YrhL